jgi:hypothetical protein
MLPEEGGSLRFPVSNAKSQVLEIHKHEKDFKGSHTQTRDSHKMEVLARIYFSIPR